MGTNTDERVAALGAELAANLPDVTAYLVRETLARIPELQGHFVDLLDTSIESNLGTVSLALRHGLGEINAPAGAREYARLLAQHGVPPTALVRAYRLGHQLALEWMLGRLDGIDPAEAMGATARLLDITFRYIDSMSEQVLHEYDAERDRWLALRSTERAEVIELLLSGAALDVTRAETVLGHRLRQRHVGAVLWTSEAMTADDLSGLEHVVGRIARAAGARGTPLFWPRDRATGFVWLPLGADSPELDPDLLEDVLRGTSVRVALGTPAGGIAGFRVTHLEALQARTVAEASDRRPLVTSYTDPDVRAAALLAADPEGTRRLVHRALGGLADDTEAAARLRETLFVFLRTQGSHLVTGERLHLHKNTVRYRIEKAIAMRGLPLDEDRLDLELALVACTWLRELIA